MLEQFVTIHRDVSNRLLGYYFLLEDCHFDPLGRPFLLALPDGQAPVLRVIAEADCIWVNGRVFGVEIRNCCHFYVVISW